MSKGKIGHWSARNIASAVAEKAFEHILAPMREQARIAAQAAYDEELDACGMTEKIRKALVLRGNRNPFREGRIQWLDHLSKVEEGAT